jgi:cytochrome oxidase Cu insertion factor (SCO1/SenC/PrrC family)
MLKPTALILLAAILLAAPATADAQARGKTRPAPKSRAATAKPPAAAGAEMFACPMHPEVTAKTGGGRCPKCGMNLVKADPAAATEPAGASETTAAKTGTPESVEPVRIPETPVLDQDGRRLDFYKDLVKGKTVAINFVFTTCAGICPPLTATFRRVQQLLGERAGREVSLISISVDPTTDTPERLKAFAEKFKAGPGWTFVTGGKPEISALLKSLGAASAEKTDHTPMILVGNDAAGHWTRAYGLSPAATLVKVIDEAAAREPAATTPATAASVPDGKPADGGKSVSAKSAAYFPNHTLVTQDDKTVRFYEDLLKGKVVLINFMFTHCAGVCSPMTANMAKVQSYLGERVGRDVSMLSISVDPANDTPAALKAYAAKHKAGPGWYFLTGKKENVDWVLYKLGGYVAEPGQHSSVLIIGNEATGEWVKVHAMSSPADIAAAVVKIAGDKAAAGHAH